MKQIITTFKVILLSVLFLIFLTPFIGISQYMVYRNTILLKEKELVTLKLFHKDVSKLKNISDSKNQCQIVKFNNSAIFIEYSSRRLTFNFKSKSGFNELIILGNFNYIFPLNKYSVLNNRFHYYMISGHKLIDLNMEIDSNNFEVIVYDNYS